MSHSKYLSSHIALNFVPVFNALHLLQATLDFSSVCTLHSETTEVFWCNGFSPFCNPPRRAHTVRETLWRHRTSMTWDSGHGLATQTLGAETKWHSTKCVKQSAICTVCGKQDTYSYWRLKTAQWSQEIFGAINFWCDTVSQFKSRWRVSSELLMTMNRPVTG